jgi:SAM-dependent methyltransferase
MRLTEQVRFCCGHALNLPFPDGSFDIVWTQNSGMQIADKGRLYHEFFRVLRPAGRLAQLEPIAGPVQPPHFPLMWAREAADSHLLTADTLREVILATGFIEHYWHPAATFREAAPNPESAPHTIQSLVMGERLAAIQEARVRNAAEDRLRTVLLVCERP